MQAVQITIPGSVGSNDATQLSEVSVVFLSGNYVWTPPINVAECSRSMPSFLFFFCLVFFTQLYVLEQGPCLDRLLSF